MSLDLEIVSDIATELAVDPAFVEKDWYSVKVLSAIAGFESTEITTIFSGGTSLSKGYNLLKRFSEDLDFRCLYQIERSGNQQRKVRSDYRKKIISEITNSEHVTLNDSDISVASNYIKFPLGYSRKRFDHASLRAGLQVEFSFTQPRLDPEMREIQSLVSQFTEEAPETKILCLSPVETASDKLSALTWRVLKRNREDENDDPAMIRHLHDLCALKLIVCDNKDLFVETASSAFEGDQLSGRRDTKEGFSDSMKLAFTQLNSDKEYKNEYSRFVEAMSYADDEENIGFEVAVENYEELISFFE
ncbi:MAG: nucleotidyl transferase AbiEii/AbiGii toxin family protein [Methylococcales bacterium]